MSKLLPLLLKPFFRSPDRGAETSVYLCQSDAVDNISGAYFANCKQKRPKPWARDDDAAERLWDISEACTGFKYPASKTGPSS